MTKKSYTKPAIVSRAVVLGVYGDYRPGNDGTRRSEPVGPTKTNPILPHES